MEEWVAIRTHDRNTGFSPKNPKPDRPYLVTRVIGDPSDLIYVVPRTTSGWEGVPTPANVIPGLNEAGNFLLDPIPVPAENLRDAEVLGPLPDEYQRRIRERLTTFLMDLDE